MLKKNIIFSFLLLLFLFSGCANLSPVSNEDKDAFLSPDTAVGRVIDLRNGGSSIREICQDTISQQKIFIGNGIPVDSADVFFPSELLNIALLQTMLGGVAKKLNDPVLDFRQSSVNALTLQFARLGSEKKDTIDFNFHVVNGKCSTTVVRVPLGYKYEVLTSLWFVKDYPWSWASYKLYDRSFSSLDTIDLLTKKLDTLNIVFYESRSLKFFLALEKPPGDWTNDSSYTVYVDGLAIPAMYKNDTLFCHYVIPSLNGSPPYNLSMECDTGRVNVYFYPVLKTMIGDGIIEVVSRRIMEGYVDHSDTTSLFSGFPEKVE